MPASTKSQKGFAPIVVLLLIVLLGGLVYFMATNKEVNFFSGASNIIQTLSGKLVRKGTAAFTPCKGATTGVNYGLVTGTAPNLKCRLISANASVAGPLIGEKVAVTGNIKGEVFYATKIVSDSSCVQQCPGKDNVLRNCRPPESDGTSEDSLCNVKGRVERCGGQSFCCPAPGAKWTTNLALCPPPVTNCTTLKSDDVTGFNNCQAQGFSMVCADKYTHKVIGCMNAGDNDCTANNANAARQVECVLPTPSPVTPPPPTPFPGTPSPVPTTTSVYFYPSRLNVTKGGNFNFSVYMNSTTTLTRGVDIKVKFDPNVFQITSAQANTLVWYINQYVPYDNTNGWVWFVGTGRSTDAIYLKNQQLINVKGTVKSTATAGNYVFNYVYPPFATDPYNVKFVPSAGTLSVTVSP